MSCCGSRRKVATVRPQTTLVGEVKTEQPTAISAPEVPKPQTSHQEGKGHATAHDPGFVARSISALDEEAESIRVAEAPPAQRGNEGPGAGKEGGGKAAEKVDKGKQEKNPPVPEEFFGPISQEELRRPSAIPRKEIRTGFDDDEDEDDISDRAPTGQKGRDNNPKDRKKPPVAVPSRAEDDEEDEDEDIGPPKVVNAFGVDTLPKDQKRSDNWFQKQKKEKTKESAVQVFKATSQELKHNRPLPKDKNGFKKANEDDRMSESSLEPTDEAIVEGVAATSRIYASDVSIGKASPVNTHAPPPNVQAHPFGFIDDP
ncbi:hypothetical protein HDU96_009349 [Phlyctochytrium bullatum]|nr:hypothetical protein HDU96_009349 [Phlyctochytrium bullatum]